MRSVRSRHFRSILLLIVVGLMARVLTQGWDVGTPPSPHPDERQVATVTQALEGWFANPQFFAYGSLHFNMIRVTTTLTGLQSNWGGLMAGGRTLSLVCSFGALLLGLWMAVKAWGMRSALIFAGLAVWIPLDQQLSHYATVEAHHALWVVAALAAMFQMARSRSGWWALVAGIAVGASLAVKISSAALVLPLVLAIGMAVAAGKRISTLWLVLPVVAGGMLAFGLGQPWAFEGGYPWVGDFNPHFLDGLRQQIAMVSGVSDVPYVRVYAPTTPVFYSLRELCLWALGPALALTALWGGLLATVLMARRWRRLIQGRLTDSSMLLVLLLAWVIPMAVRLSTLEVKFLRYWAPLVVPLTLLGAWYLARLRGVVGRRVTAAVLCLTALWGIAYLWAFVEPHPFATAAPWLRTVVGQQDVVAWEHWDEHLHGIGSESLTLESYNLPDDDAKVTSWCSTLAMADWVVLTSNRVRRTVLVNPERYERTGRLYRMLLAGEAGFEVAATVSRSPRIAGLRFPVQRADESFVNYEFPRVIVLRKTADIDPVDLAYSSRQSHPILDQLDSAALDRQFVDPAPDIRPRATAGLQVLQTGQWLALFLGGAALWLVILLPWLGSWPDAGLGVAFVMGWVVPAWLAWIGSEVLNISVGPGNSVILVAGVTLVGLVFSARRWSDAWRLARAKKRAIRAVAVVFVAVFLFFLGVRLFNPAIHWGEKPMDFTFFNAFVSASQWPPGEPWMAGEPLHYYYFSDVLAAFPTLVIDADTGIAYNLMCATVPALAAAPLAALGLLVASRRRKRWFLLMPIGVLMVGNLAWPRLLSLAKADRWFDLWWATSRVIPGYAITEYPLWTVLFADLHAHFVALPLLIVALLWAWVVTRSVDQRWVGAAVFCGLSVAALVATNPWDIPVFALSLLVTVLAVASKPFVSLSRLTAAAIVSVFAAAPFLVELQAWLGGGGAGGRPLVFVTAGDFAPWWAILLHFGLFLAPLLTVALFRPRNDLVITGAIAAAGLAVGIAFGSSAAGLALAAAALFLTMVRWAPDRLQAIAWSLAGSAMVLVAVAERLTLMDRMNTIFKIYNGAWLLLAFALAVVLLRSRGREFVGGLSVFLVLFPLALANLPLGIFQGWLQPRMISPRPTLDGRAFLTNDPSEDFLVSALNGAARPGDVVAEAAGSSYGQFTRISMHTGLSTVVGWEWHLRQRGQSLGAIEDRIRDLNTIFAGVDFVERRRALERYGVDWIVLGELERETYGLTAIDPFAGVPGVRVWTRQGSTVLYRFLGNL